MKQFFKRITGVDTIEQQISQELDKKLKELEESVTSFIKFRIKDLELEHEKALDAKIKAEKEMLAAQEAERLTKLSPKQRATEAKEPWWDIVQGHSDPNNPKTGFMEFDWNEYHIAKLRSIGYEGVTDEDVFEAWFKEWLRNMAIREGVFQDPVKGSGFISATPLGNGRTEIG